MNLPPKKRLTVYVSVITVLALAAAVSWTGYVKASSERQHVTAATVHITTISTSPDYSKPWQSQATKTTTASGAIINGNRILTNAHAVLYGASIEVKRPGLQKSFPAKVELVDHGCDLALLSVEDPSFFAGVEPLAIGRLAPIGSTVDAYGYPVGGETVSATSGVVSRVELSTYAHSERDLLISQIDAAINPGNSGGPVVSDGRIVGIAVQGLEEAENVGYMIPVPVVGRFLQDAADGAIAGIPDLGAYCLPVENEALREYLGLTERQGGAIVTDINFGSASWGKLETDDVLISIDGVPIANDCTVPFADDTRVHFAHLIQQKQVGETSSFTVWRDRAQVTINLQLSRSGLLVPLPAYEPRCAYRVLGGLVFQPATVESFTAQTSEAPTAVLHCYVTSSYATKERRGLVVLTNVLPHRVNRGYQDWLMDTVETVNGVAVRDFEHFNELLDAVSGEWLNLTMGDKSRLVLSLDEARKSNEEILKTFAIAQDRWPAARSTVAMK